MHSCAKDISEKALPVGVIVTVFLFSAPALGPFAAALPCSILVLVALLTFHARLAEGCGRWRGLATALTADGGPERIGLNLAAILVLLGVAAGLRLRSLAGICAQGLVRTLAWPGEEGRRHRAMDAPQPDP
jgi:hypothetical protein